MTHSIKTSRVLLLLKPTRLARLTRTNVTVASVVDVNNDIKLKSWREIPGPVTWPIIGQLPSFLRKPLSDVANFQENLFKMYGPVVRLDRFGGRPPMLFVYDPEVIAFIIRSENWNPVRPGSQIVEYYRKSHNKSSKDAPELAGLLIDHDEPWRAFRSAVNPILMQQKIIEFYRNPLSDAAEDMIKRMRIIRNETSNRLNNDVVAEFNLWSLESIAVSALETRLNLLDPNLAEESPEKRLRNCVHGVLDISRQLDFGISFWKYYQTKNFKKAMQLCEEQENLVKYFIKKARKEKTENEKPEEEKGIINRLFEKDERIALIMASDMLLAGVDTTAGAITSSLYFMSTNQDKQDKLRQEVNSGDVSKKYLRACIKEALRILPVASANMRCSTKDYNIYGYKIPKDTSILFNHQVICRMESQFPRPLEYIPERWTEDGELSYKKAHPFALSPFGFGARACIGRKIAEMEIEILLSKIIQNFKVEWSDAPPPAEIPSLLIFKGPFNFVFKDIL